MLIKRPADIRSSEITDKKLYLNRREFIRRAGGTARGGGARRARHRGVVLEAAHARAARPQARERQEEPVQRRPTAKPNTWEHITTYNNYYEFGTDKDSPSMLARNFKTEPWTVAVDGECAKKGNVTPRGHPQGRRRSRSASTATAASKRGRW